eukprot:TRINITY_DN1280_c0_g1_i2.p1 TRINITY_DN1280_c0_g1~~TRINITY_DN1280_c0_g1_i2.p1  ORF type:complete len:416 (-),score=94.52 TRINITY_DN1280_c0_g1_i2:70-1317(-)
MEYRAVTPEPSSYSLVRGPRGGDGASGRFWLLLVSFCQLVLVFATISMFLTGLLLLSESGEDTRGVAAEVYNKEVGWWNLKGKEEFISVKEASANTTSLAVGTTDYLWAKFLDHDSDPGELAQPDPGLFTGSLHLEVLAAESWDVQELVPMVPVKFKLGTQSTEVLVPHRFTEFHCKWIQRGSGSHQVCAWHYFVLAGMCLKADKAPQGSKGWKPALTMRAMSGNTAGYGCYQYGGAGVPGTYSKRSTNLWSVGLYKDLDEQADTQPSIPVHVRSYGDPALIADALTAGTYDFGPSQEAKFFWGLVLTLISSVILAGFCFCLFLQYSWPQANSNSDRVLYFYRRYCRQSHIWIQRKWAGLFASSGSQADHWDDDDLATQQEESETWTGPNSGGYTLGKEAPQLFNPNDARPVRAV